MDVVGWLEEIAKWDELIIAKDAEMDRILEAACNTVANYDGMPHAPGVSDKVGNLTVKLISLAEEREQYEINKQAMIRVLEQLPAAQFGVLHREYVRYMTQEQIALEMGYCTVQVWRIKKKALVNLEKLLKDVMECNAHT